MSCMEVVGERKPVNPPRLSSSVEEPGTWQKNA